MKPTTLIACAMLTLAPSLLQAQKGNGSDVTGPRPPGGGGGKPPGGGPPGGGKPRPVMFGESFSIAPTPAAPAITVPVAALRGAVDNGALLRGFGNRAGAPRASLQQAFVRDFRGALDGDAQSIARATTAFNAMVADASPAYLAAPPAEFATAHAVLQQMAKAGR